MKIIPENWISKPDTSGYVLLCCSMADTVGSSLEIITVDLKEEEIPFGNIRDLDVRSFASAHCIENIRMTVSEETCI